MGRREEKKIQTRQKILEVAKKIFTEYGYEDTKTSVIAKEVGIAEGTIFNYFDTKADIIVGVIGEYYAIDDYAFNYDLKEPNEIKEEIYNAIKYYLSNVHVVDKSLLKVVFANVAINENNSHKVFKAAKAVDDKIMENLGRFIEHAYEEKSDDEIQIIMRIIYSSFLISFGEYMIEEEMSVDDLVSNIYKVIEFVI